MKWGNSARNFIIALSFASTFLGIDLYFYLSGSETFSQTFWHINQFSLFLALGAGVIIGHIFTVPKKENNGSKSDK